MSGAIFTPLEGPGALDGTSGHPLVCPLCHAQYERPCLLDCFHEFCAGCLRGRAADGRLACPLCQHQTVVKGPSGLPPVDRLLQFLVDSSGDGAEVVRCANCDLECGKQDAETTYFCNTCGQPLCARCRDETHRARMFARHDIVALGQRSRDVLQKCTLHAEPYVLFSTDKKSLLCIRCFRDMQGESRVHCVDLESAYVQGCERLQQAVLEVKALQSATREAIELLQAMVEEVRRSAAEEEAAIQALFSSMQDKLLERMGDILHKALQVDAQIASEYASVEGLRAVFQEIWEDSYQRVANEQEIYEAQLHDLLQLKQENAYLTTITKQITPYVRSIAKVKERLEPRFQVPVDEPSDHPQNMHDDGVNAEAPARSDPVSVTEKKEKNSELRNSRALGSLAEEPPLKNKDTHRPKSKNGTDVSTRRERPA
ncbi:RING finger protein 207 [Odocoileus virginianus]|uniref:RING finger protein 207 n=1 Tax=Odocoileus virginianus TaxID=9874 RepID=A0ABM4IR51_ODOVR